MPRLASPQKYYTPEDHELILAFARDHGSPPMRCLVRVFEFLGCRVGEGCRLKSTDFFANWSRVTYQQEKSKLWITKEVPDELQRILKEYYHAWHHRMREDYLFFPWRNQSKNLHIKSGAVAEFFSLMREHYAHLGWTKPYKYNKAGRPQYRHAGGTMRHHYLARIWKACFDAKAAQQIIGHTKFETTVSYINVLETFRCEKEIIERAFAKNG